MEGGTPEYSLFCFYAFFPVVYVIHSFFCMRKPPSLLRAVYVNFIIRCRNDKLLDEYYLVCIVNIRQCNFYIRFSSFFSPSEIFHLFKKKKNYQAQC